MPEIDPSVIVHRLNVNSARAFAQERDKAIAEEVRKLL